MIKKFTIDNDIYVFIECEDCIVASYNNTTEFAPKSIITMPENEKEVLQALRLNVWYPITEI